MKFKHIFALFSIVFAVLTSTFTVYSNAISEITVGDVKSVIGGILAYELNKNGYMNEQDWINGSITENAGQSSEWYAIILSKSGNYDFSGYDAALVKYISENKINSATSRMKNVLALLAVGDNNGQANKIAENSVGEQGIMSLIYGLHLLNNGCVCSRYTTRTLTDDLLNMQFEDGGWAIMGENGDIDVTAMTVQALAPQYNENETVAAAVNNALGFLSSKQLDNGGYKSFGVENPESAAQVLIAVSQLGIDINDERFVKNNKTLIDGITRFALPDGSFSHTPGGDSNETATIQAYLSLTAYILAAEKGEKLYIFDKTEPTAEESPSETAVETTQTTPLLTSSAAQTIDAPALPESTETVQNDNKDIGYKQIAYIIIGVSALTVCIILFALKKRRMSNFIAVIIIAGAASAFIFFTEFRSSEVYYSGANSPKENTVGTVTITIRCDTIVGKYDSPYIPYDGVILDITPFDITEGETVYDILTQAARKYNIQMQADANGYISGIGYLYEYDCGDLSGWIYHVNGDTPFMMCSEYKLSDGDKIEWLYTCDLGNDL